MKWTTEAPRQEHAGRFFWMRIGNGQPEVVLIQKWSGKRTYYRTATNVCWLAYHDNPTPTMEEIMSHTMWAGPIDPPPMENENG